MRDPQTGITRSTDAFTSRFSSLRIIAPLMFERNVFAVRLPDGRLQLVSHKSQSSRKFFCTRGGGFQKSPPRVLSFRARSNLYLSVPKVRRHSLLSNFVQMIRALCGAHTSQATALISRANACTCASNSESPVRCCDGRDGDGARMIAEFARTWRSRAERAVWE